MAKSSAAPAHTPLPWAQHPSFPYCVIPLSDVGKRIGGASDPETEFRDYAKRITTEHGTSYPEYSRSRVTPEEALANAALIVTAVNAHQALYEALSAARDAWQNDAYTDVQFEAFEKITAALALADAAQGEK